MQQCEAEPVDSGMALSLLSRLNPLPVPTSEVLTHVLLCGAGMAVTHGVIKLGGKLISMISSSTSPSTSSKKTDHDELEEAGPMFEHPAELEARKPALWWNTGMFFPDYFASEQDSTTQQFLWYFAQARVSIRGCIYNCSFPELESVLEQQYNRGLIVEFIAGHEMTAKALRKRGIPCGLLQRQEGTPETDQLMHHKFVVIDDEAVLSGSMNWTTEGIVTNKENVTVTTNPKIVGKYVEEFFRLKKKSQDVQKFY